MLFSEHVTRKALFFLGVCHVSSITYKAKYNATSPFRIRPWLRGFVKNMGFSVASNLLGESYLAKIQVTADSSPSQNHVVFQERSEETNDDKTGWLAKFLSKAAPGNAQSEQ